MSLDSLKDAFLHYSDTAEAWSAAKPVLEELLKNFSASDIIGEMAVLAQGTNKHWKAATLRWRMQGNQQRHIEKSRPVAEQQPPRPTRFGFDCLKLMKAYLRIPMPWPPGTTARYADELEALYRRHGQLAEADRRELQALRERSRANAGKKGA